jgi:nitrilase
MIDPADVEDAELREAIGVLPAMTGDGYVIDPMGEVVAGPAVGETMLLAEVSHARIREAKALCDTAGHYSRPDVLQLRVKRTPAARIVDETP